jgi:hypothetical protein
MSVLLGVSAHPLLVHLTVVAIPLAALLAMVVAGFPRVQALIKLTTLVLGALSVALVPLMESPGKALEEKVPDSAAVERHAQLRETLLPWVIGLLIAIVVVLAADRWLRPARPGVSATSGAGRSRLASRVVTVSVAAGRDRCRAGHTRANGPDRPQRRAGDLVQPWRRNPGLDSGRPR